MARAKARLASWNHDVQVNIVVGTTQEMNKLGAAPSVFFTRLPCSVVVLLSPPP
jgi:hypothetical protein